MSDVHLLADGKSSLSPSEAGSTRSMGIATPASDLLPPEPTRILRLPEVIARVGLRRASVYAYVKDGRFPAPIVLGARAVGWLESEIEAWLQDRIQRRARYYAQTTPRI